MFPIASAAAPLFRAGADSSWDLALWAGGSSSTHTALQAVPPCFPPSYRNPPPPGEHTGSILLYCYFHFTFSQILTKVIFCHFNGNLERGLLCHGVKPPEILGGSSFLSSLRASPCVPSGIPTALFSLPKDCPCLAPKIVFRFYGFDDVLAGSFKLD